MTDWDRRFLDLADHFGQWSKDPSTKQGAVVVRQDRTIASTGFNGFPRHTSDDPDLYNDREEKYGRVQHAELNALLFAREDLNGYALYTSPMPPCDRCAAAIVQKGIWIVYTTNWVIPERWEKQAERAEALFSEAGIPLIRISRSEKERLYGGPRCAMSQQQGFRCDRPRGHNGPCKSANGNPVI